jgi:hypothetical protein
MSLASEPITRTRRAVPWAKPGQGHPQLVVRGRWLQGIVLGVREARLVGDRGALERDRDRTETFSCAGAADFTITVSP